jgi:hypothetical protein
MLIGSARVSTDEQSLDLQLDALKAAGCRRVFTDQVSTTKADHPGLAEAVSHLRDRDVLVLWKLDRLGRTVKGLVDFVADLRRRGVQFRSLTDAIDTTTPAGRFFFHVIGIVATETHALQGWEESRPGMLKNLNAYSLPKPTPVGSWGWNQPWPRWMACWRDRPAVKGWP